MQRFLLVSLLLLFDPSQLGAAEGPPADRTLDVTQMWVQTNACASCLADLDRLQLHDDGLHGDGAAGDRIYGADVVVDQPAGIYYWSTGRYSGSYFERYRPNCWCSPPPSVRLWTTGPGEVIHFTDDERVMPGWFPEYGGIACSHPRPNDSPLVLTLGVTGRCDPFLYAVEYPATHTGTLWEAIVTIESTGCRTFGFIAEDHSVFFVDSYSSTCGCYQCEQYYPYACTSVPNTLVKFQFDESVGRLRAVNLGATPTLRSTWGALKGRYR